MQRKETAEATQLKQVLMKSARIMITIVFALVCACVVFSDLPPVIIIDPVSDEILEPNTIAECIAADNITKVEFMLVNTTGTYDLSGASGNTTDYLSTDGWKQTIQTSNLGDGTYNFTVLAYAYNGSDFVLEANDTETNIRIDHTSPTGSMDIYGPAGNTTTGSRIVYLNVSYSDNYAVALCRYANDLEANLNNVLWEPCTSPKAWLLGSATGNKTVYYQIKDYGENTVTYNDSIEYYPGVDYTAPTAPTIAYEGPGNEDVDWINDNTSLTIQWGGATEDMSTIYYRIKTCVEGVCDLTPFDMGANTSLHITGASNQEGANLSFQVQAYNSANLSSGWLSSDGARIDMTDPAAPTINSSTHPAPNTAYSKSTISFNWTANDVLSGGNMSGIEGYSYLLDTNRYTTPDTLLDQEKETQMQIEISNVNTSGPLKNSGSDPAWAVYFQGNGNFTKGDRLNISYQLFEESSETSDTFQYYVFILKKDPGDSFDYDERSNAISNIEYNQRDILYTYSPQFASTYYSEVTINDTLDDDDQWYVGIMGDSTDDDNTNSHHGAGTNDALEIDNSTQLFACRESVGCLNYTTLYEAPMTVMNYKAINSTTYSGLGDGTYYFHVRAKDKAGNWGNVTHRRAIVDAGGVSVSISSPVDGQVFTTSGTTTNVSVKVLTSGNATVNITAVYSDGSNQTFDSASVRNVHIFEDIQLQYGTNKLIAKAKTSSDAITTSAPVYVIVNSDVLPVSNRTLRLSYGAGATYSGANIRYFDQTGTYVGIATESSNAFTAGLVATADTEDDTLKIFMSNTLSGSTLTNLESDLSDDSFLDRVNPRIGSAEEYTDYVIRGELRYEEVYLGGLFVRPSGIYELTLLNEGLSEEGDVNVTVSHN